MNVQSELSAFHFHDLFNHSFNRFGFNNDFMQQFDWKIIYNVKIFPFPACGGFIEISFFLFNLAFRVILIFNTTSSVP